MQNVDGVTESKHIDHLLPLVLCLPVIKSSSPPLDHTQPAITCPLQKPKGLHKALPDSGSDQCNIKIRVDLYRTYIVI